MVSEWLERRKAKAECPLCGRQRLQRKFKRLYGTPICHSCCMAFANQRQFAYIIDNVILFFAAGTMIGVGLEFATNFLSASPDFEEAFMVFGTQLTYLTAFLLKDGIAGRSLGKLLTGVHVVDTRTGEAIGFTGSLKRNLPLLIPLLPLIAAMQLISGPRTGDGWARTKVIWNRYADHPVFAVAPPDEVEAQDRRGEIPVATIEDGDNPYRAPLT